MKPFAVPLANPGEFSGGNVCLVCGAENGVAPVVRHLWHTRYIDRTTWFMRILNVIALVLSLGGLGGLFARVTTSETNSADVAVPLCPACINKLEAEDGKKKTADKFFDWGLVSFLAMTLLVCATFLFMGIVAALELHQLEDFEWSLLLYVTIPAMAGFFVLIWVFVFLNIYIKGQTSIKVKDIGDGFIVFKVKPGVAKRLKGGMPWE